MKKLIETEVLAGCVLEEALAALLRENGYVLLVDESQDEEALENEPHGLTVRGRGANHQVDVLGQFEFSIPFSLPIRLFAEAKFKKMPVGIADVRNALGLVNDVNERYTVDAKYKSPLRRYHYRYALFSTSGFSSHAQRFALTHQISLIDLQGPAFSDLRRSVERAARSLRGLANSAGLPSFPIKQARIALRKVLGTWEIEGEAALPGRSELLLPENDLREIAVALRDQLQGGLMFGFPQGPFVLVLQPENNEKFDKFLSDSPSQVDIDIRFASDDSGETGEWALVFDPQWDLVVRFGLPPLLEEWLLTDNGIDLDRVEQVKNHFLPYITIFHHDNQISQLRYRKIPPLASADLVLRDDSSELRSFLADPNLAYGTREKYEKNSPYRRSRRSATESPATQSRNRFAKDVMYRIPTEVYTIYAVWDFEEIIRLFRCLHEARLLWQADIIREAALEEGKISVERIYEIAGKSGPGVLSGLNRQVKNIWQDMQAEKLVKLGVTPPLRPLRDGLSSRKVTHYAIPEEFVRLLDGHRDIREPSK